MEEIAEKFGVTRQRVSALLRDAGAGASGDGVALTLLRVAERQHSEASFGSGTTSSPLCHIARAGRSCAWARLVSNQRPLACEASERRYHRQRPGMG